MFYLLIRVGECTASHIAGVHSNRVLFSGTVIIKAQFKQRTLVVKSPRTKNINMLKLIEGLSTILKQ